ncbi:STAS domain-containing protein [Amycolatopsis aidingensis]|uniref:STAS domain-containing protein n=1 Tax=Amycolatopsis aidingensis TaxID=2842453 RepID=UPI001C0C2AA9|nr:STAS domain-containing protein [Amycolatopsis aidingensis]
MRGTVTARDNLRIRGDRLDAISVVRVDGEVDLGNANLLDDPLDAALDDGPAGVIIDLSNVRFFGSSGLSRLVAVARRSEHVGVPLAVVSNERQVLRPIRAVGLADYLRVRTSVRQAVRELGVVR